MRHFYWQASSDEIFSGSLHINQKDYSNIISNDYFDKLVSSIRGQNSITKDRAQKLKKDMVDLIMLLNKELE